MPAPNRAVFPKTTLLASVSVPAFRIPPPASAGRGPAGHREAAISSAVTPSSGIVEHPVWTVGLRCHLDRHERTHRLRRCRQHRRRRRRPRSGCPRRRGSRHCRWRSRAVRSARASGRRSRSSWARRRRAIASRIPCSVHANTGARSDVDDYVGLGVRSSTPCLVTWMASSLLLERHIQLRDRLAAQPHGQAVVLHVDHRAWMVCLHPQHAGRLGLRKDGRRTKRRSD